MRIAIFTDTFLPQVNGAVRSIVTTANFLAKSGHTVAIFTINTKKINKKIKYSDLDSRVIVHPFPSFTLPSYKEMQVRIPTFFPSLFEISKFEPDIIHSHTAFGIGWEAVTASNFLKVPLVGTYHTFLAEYLKHVKLDYALMKKIVRRYLSFYYNRCDAVIAPSQILADELVKYNLTKPVLVISNPLDLKYFSTDISKEVLRKKYNYTMPTIINFGRISYEKNIDVLLKAIAEVKKSIPNVNMIIMGDGPQKKSIETLIKRLKLEKNIKMTGILQGQELVERIAGGDFFVSASDSETQGLVFLESMSLGLPVIGVRAGGVPEYVSNNHNGLLVEPGNVKQLTQAIMTLIKDNLKRDEMGKNAIQSVKKYQAENIISEFEEIYNNLIFNK